MPGLALQACAGGGYKDTTRIAASSPEMWRDICLWNRDNLLHQIELYEARLNHIKAILKAGDGEGLVREFTLAKQRRGENNLWPFAGPPSLPGTKTTPTPPSFSPR